MEHTDEHDRRGKYGRIDRTGRIVPRMSDIDLDSHNTQRKYASEYENFMHIDISFTQYLDSLIIYSISTVDSLTECLGNIMRLYKGYGNIGAW
jgi:hypothetical protein